MEQFINYIKEEPTILAIPFYLVTMAIENFVLWRKGNPYDIADTAASFSGGIGSLVVRFFWNILFVLLLVAVYNNGLKLFDITWKSWILLVILDDFTLYWCHRFSHEIRIFWATHIVHHSSQRFYYPTAVRQSLTAPIVETPFWLPIAFLGFPPHAILIQMSVSLIYQYCIHSETIGRLGWSEYFMNTPSHHRVHHGSNLEYIDKNYGGIFIIWDRIFRTFEPEVAPARYGLMTNLNTHNWLTIQFHEFGDIIRDAWRETTITGRMRQIFGSPTRLAKAKVKLIGESPDFNLP